MKKRRRIGIILLLVWILAGCERFSAQTTVPSETTEPVQTAALVETTVPDETTVPHPAISEETLIRFSEMLDREQFFPSIMQKDFVEQVGKYQHNGSNISNHLSGFFYDGAYGGGYRVDGKYGLLNDFRVTEDRTHTNYTNRFYTTVPLTGLSLLCGIDFGDTLETVLQKLEIKLNPETGFISDLDQIGVMTLCATETASLELTDYKLLPSENTDNGGKQLYDYELKYTEIYPFIRGDSKPATVTRYIKLAFSKESAKLGYVELSVNEYYGINQ